METPAKIFTTQPGRLQSELDKLSSKTRRDWTKPLGERNHEMPEASRVLTTLWWEPQSPPGDLLTALQEDMQVTEDYQWENWKQPLKSNKPLKSE